MRGSVSRKIVGGAALAALVLSQATGAAPPRAAPSTSPEAAASTSPAAAATFKSRCTACHTYGKGVKVGPDLKGVTERHPREWLRRFIHASSAMIAAGDPAATALFARFKRQRMPDWTDLSPRQIDDLLDYLAAGGPDLKPADEREASEARPADVERGRALFAGGAPFALGAAACTACHAVPGGPWLQGGSLGPDLDAVYPRYRDQALTEYLRHHAPAGAAAAPGASLTPDEIFALKAYLRRAAQEQPDGVAGRTVAQLPRGGR